MSIDAKRTLEMGLKWPFDAPDSWVRDESPELPAKDWAHAAARGILFDLNDRRWVKYGFVGIDEEVRAEIVESMAAVIREAHRRGDPT